MLLLLLLLLLLSEAGPKRNSLGRGTICTLPNIQEMCETGIIFFVSGDCMTASDAQAVSRSDVIDPLRPLAAAIQLFLPYSTTAAEHLQSQID